MNPIVKFVLCVSFAIIAFEMHRTLSMYSPEYREFFRVFFIELPPAIIKAWIPGL
jgi:hypothetical protein